MALPQRCLSHRELCVTLPGNRDLADVGKGPEVERTPTFTG